MADSGTRALLGDLAEGLDELTDHLERADAMLERGADSDSAREAVRRGLRVARSALERVQSAVDASTEPTEAGRPFTDAVRAVVDGDLSEQTEFEFDGPRLDATLRDELREALLSVVREGVAHFTEHGEAERLSVTIDVDAERLQLAISDCGTGFAPHEIGDETAQLSAIRETLREMGGDLALETSWREGSSIVVTAPHDIDR